MSTTRKKVSTIKQMLYNNKYSSSLLNNFTPVKSNTKTELTKPNGSNVRR
jgi:hypothetical protein